MARTTYDYKLRRLLLMGCFASHRHRRRV